MEVVLQNSSQINIFWGMLNYLFSVKIIWKLYAGSLLKKENYNLMNHFVWCFFFQVKNSWMAFVLVIQRNSNFQCGILRLVPEGQVWGLQHKQDSSDRDRSTHLYNEDPIGPETWSSIPPKSLSGLTLGLYTSSAGSPSSGRQGVRTMGICEFQCVFACVCGDLRILSHLPPEPHSPAEPPTK